MSLLGEGWQWRNVGGALGTALLVGAVVVGNLHRKKPGMAERGTEQRADRTHLLQMESMDAAPTVEPSDWIVQILRSDAEISTREERARVWSFLEKCCTNVSRPEEGDWFEIDEALFWLRGAKQVPTEVEAGLIEIGSNPVLSQTLRCFVLQHLGDWAEEHPMSRTTIEKLRAVASGMDARGAGSVALRVLNRCRSLRGDEEWLGAKVTGLLGNEDASTEQRVAALQIAVELGVTMVEPLARKFVASGRQVGERVNAFFALGRLGNHETLRWISAQPPPTEALVQEARERAIQSLLSK